MLMQKRGKKGRVRSVVFTFPLTPVHVLTSEEGGFQVLVQPAKLLLQVHCCQPSYIRRPGRRGGNMYACRGGGRRDVLLAGELCR
jgi:hypothetical protein